MSVMLCEKCECIVNTDNDPDSLYVIGFSDKCVCEWCRDEHGYVTEFDEDEHCPPSAPSA